MSDPSDSKYFTTPDGIRLHCLRVTPSSPTTPTTPTMKDAAAPTVLLHGGGANAHWWDHLAPRFAVEGPVYALDFRGHGDSEYPANREVGAFNFDLEAMLEWLGRDDVHLIGHSLGAAVAFDHASRFPKTRSLVLIDLARGSTHGSGRRARLALALRRTYPTRADAVERFRFLPESSHPPESLRRAIAEHSVREEADGRFGYKFDPGWFGLPSRPRPNPEDIECPTLLVRGEESHLLSEDAAHELVAALEAGELIVVPNAGHHVLIDQPDVLFARVAQWRSKTRPSH